MQTCGLILHCKYAGYGGSQLLTSMMPNAWRVGIDVRSVTDIFFHSFYCNCCPSAETLTRNSNVKILPIFLHHRISKLSQNALITSHEQARSVVIRQPLLQGLSLDPHSIIQLADANV